MLITHAAREARLGDWLFGTPVEQLVRNIAVPVLVVNSAAKQRYRRVVVGVKLDAVESELIAAASAIAPGAGMPRFSYALQGTASDLLQSDDEKFAAFASQVRRDVERTLKDYRIEDKSALAELLNAKLELQELAGDYAGGLKTIATLRKLEQKPAQKLLTGLYTRARLQAALAAHAASGPDFDKAFRTRYTQAIEPLPWKSSKSSVRRTGRWRWSRWRLARWRNSLPPRAASSSRSRPCLPRRAPCRRSASNHAPAPRLPRKTT